MSTHPPQFIYDPRLIVESGFWDLTPEELARIANGCGSKASLVDLVPDSILGTDIWLICCIHDYAYYVGRNKFDADRAFLHNLLIFCEDPNIFRYLSRARIAFMYFEAVVGFGNDAFGARS